MGVRIPIPVITTLLDIQICFGYAHRTFYRACAYGSGNVLKIKHPQRAFLPLWIYVESSQVLVYAETWDSRYSIAWPTVWMFSACSSGMEISNSFSNSMMS